MKTSLKSTILLLVSITVSHAAEPTLERITVYKGATGCKTTEIVSIQETTKRLALSCSNESMMDIISIENPSKPISLSQFNVAEEEITTIAFHSSENIVAAALKNNNPFATGKVQIHDASSGELIDSFETGVHPDDLAFSPNGKYLVVANEGSEPENVVSFEIKEILYAAVGLERANAIALVSLADPTQPKVLSVQAVDSSVSSGGDFAPEGLAYYENSSRHYIFSANEKSSTMTVMEVSSTSESLAAN